jgi:hypothetical protein
VPEAVPEAPPGAEPAQVADAIASALQAIDTALHPIIGERGVAALYSRSLYLTSSAHPWLAGMHEDAQTAMDLAALKSTLAQQSTDHAAAGGRALLQTLYDLLASLIGSSLTERLLRSVAVNSLNDPHADDASP